MLPVVDDDNVDGEDDWNELTYFSLPLPLLLARWTSSAVFVCLAPHCVCVGGGGAEGWSVWLAVYFAGNVAFSHTYTHKHTHTHWPNEASAYGSACGMNGKIFLSVFCNTHTHSAKVAMVKGLSLSAAAAAVKCFRFIRPTVVQKYEPNYFKMSKLFWDLSHWFNQEVHFFFPQRCSKG